MKEPRRFHELRSKYRRERDALVLKRLTQPGKQPTSERLLAEQRAAATVKRARAKLQAAISSANEPYSAVSDHGLGAIRWRYTAAFDAYHAIVAGHARQALAGDPISVDELLREQEAREALAVARRELFNAFGRGGGISPSRQKTSDHVYERNGAPILEAPKAARDDLMAALASSTAPDDR